MDPDVLVDELIDLVNQLRDHHPTEREYEPAVTTVTEIIEKATDLQEWIIKGGFIPVGTNPTIGKDYRNAS